MNKLWLRSFPLALGFAVVAPALAQDPGLGEPTPQEPTPLEPTVGEPATPGEPGAEPGAEPGTEPGMAAGELQVAYPNPNGLVRPIYAFGVPEGQTPYVVITSKTLTGECQTREEAMTLLPADALTQELCAELGGTATLVDGEIQGCAIGENGEAADIWEYRFKRLETELNFNVVLRDGSELVGESGWYPLDTSNACPRDM